MILTDAEGRPIPELEPLPPGATIEEKIAHMRARTARSDRILDIGNRAAAKAFKV